MPDDTRADLSPRSTGRSDAGSASVLGGAVFNNTLLSMDDVVIGRNTASAEGPDGAAQGGGIWNGDLIAGPPVLRLENSRVVGNTLEASPDIPRQGGGMFTTFPVIRVNTLIAGNQPDQCVSCSSALVLAPALGRRALAKSHAARASEGAASGGGSSAESRTVCRGSGSRRTPALSAPTAARGPLRPCGRAGCVPLRRPLRCAPASRSRSPPASNPIPPQTGWPR